MQPFQKAVALNSGTSSRHSLPLIVPHVNTPIPLRQILWAATVARRVQIALERANFDEAHCAINWGEAVFSEGASPETPADEMAVAELPELPVRIINALDREDIVWVSDLLEKTQFEIMSIQGIDKKYMLLIEQSLAAAGFARHPGGP